MPSVILLKNLVCRFVGKNRHVVSSMYAVSPKKLSLRRKCVVVVVSITPLVGGGFSEALRVA